MLSVVRELLVEGRTAPTIADAVVALVAKLVARNGDLERRLAEKLGRRHKSEGFSTEQLLLFLDELDAEDQAALAGANESLRESSAIDARRRDEATEDERAKNPRRQPPLRQPAPSTLRRVVNAIKVPDEKRRCPTCKGERACIGHDVTEVIDLIPAEVIVRIDQREKLACFACDGELERAPLGDKVVPSGKLGSALVTELLVDKYRDGLPLHRQKQRFERLGLKLPMSTLADQVTWAADLLRPIWRAAMNEVLAAEVMHLDGTSLPVLDRDSANGLRVGTLWGYVGGDTALYLYASTGKRKGQKPGEIGPEDFLAQRNGYTVADAATLFDTSFDRPGIIECGCNMHARRYFTKALDRGDSRAALPLAAFKKLYEIEEEIRGRDRAERLAARKARSHPVYRELIHWCKTYQPLEPPSSPLGVAIRYLMNNGVPLTRFLEDAVIPLDNGAVERLHVRAALTRKNFLFAGSDAGAERAAIVYTVIGSCALAGVNPVEYLNDVLPSIARGLRIKDAAALLPARWKTPSLADVGIASAG